MSGAKQGIITLSVFIIIVAIMIILYAAQVIQMNEIIPLIVAFYGCWLIVEAGIRTQNPSKYGRSAFDLLGWGLLLGAIGFGWDLYIRGVELLYVAAVVLLLLGILGIVAALRITQKKT